MSDFFNSDMVQQAAREMEQLQMKAMELTLSNPLDGNNKIQQLNYLSAVKELIEKQQIFYARLKLSDDPEAIAARKSVEEGARMLYGGQEGNNVTQIMQQMLDKLSYFESVILAGGG